MEGKRQLHSSPLPSSLPPLGIISSSSRKSSQQQGMPSLTMSRDSAQFTAAEDRPLRDRRSACVAAYQTVLLDADGTISFPEREEYYRTLYEGGLSSVEIAAW